MDAFVKRLPSGTTSTAAQNPPASDDRRPLKRLKREDDCAGESALEDSESAVLEDGLETCDEGGWQTSREQRVPDVEHALPASQPDEAAFEAYEEYKSSQVGTADAKQSGHSKPLWIKGRCSIYVDAFNLALDTVLEEEAKLFHDRELHVFEQWKCLDYEAQYLYVRLFLRKTAAWHRWSRLGYYDDIADIGKPIGTLQQIRPLPNTCQQETPSQVGGIDVEDERLGWTFAFAESSDELLTDMEEAASLLYLDELKTLAKDMKLRGRNKPELIRSLAQMSRKQTSLMEMGLSRQNSRESDSSEDAKTPRTKTEREDRTQKKLFFAKVTEMLGPCVRLSSAVCKLFERVHLVFYRSTEWTEKSLTTVILAKIARRNFPEYIVCRTSTIFASREHLLEYEAAIRLEAEVDTCLEGSAAVLDQGCRRILEIFDVVYPRWTKVLAEEREKERTVYESGEGAYLRRFNPGHSYTRILAKAAYAMGKQKDYQREHNLLKELLDQKMFHLARRGGWYERKALLEENYMAKLGEACATTELEQRKKDWCKTAAATCEAALQDPDCHLTFHFGLQKRLLKLERRLRIPRRLQHDFGHVRLSKPVEMTVEGIQLKRKSAAFTTTTTATTTAGPGSATKTVWLDEVNGEGECSVEEMCLSHFRTQGWKGYHSEGRIVRTLFAYLLYDVLFAYVPNVFQTAFQTCPLDLHTDVFFATRASEMNHRLAEIDNGGAERLLRAVWEREHARRTSVVGLDWDYDVEELAELVRCFGGRGLAAVCRVLAQEYRLRGGGVPDLILWRRRRRRRRGVAEAEGDGEESEGEVMFVEVKSENDRLSETQRLWMHVLAAAGVKVALCHAVAKEVRVVDQ